MIGATSPWQQSPILSGLFVLHCVIDSSQQTNATGLCVLFVKGISAIRRRSDYIIGFIAPAIGPNKSKKFTRLTVYVAKFDRKTTYMASQMESYQLWNHVCCFHSNFAAYIVCRCYKPCEFPGFVWTDCWGNKSYYVITSPANRCSTSQGLKPLLVHVHYSQGQIL